VPEEFYQAQLRLYKAQAEDESWKIAHQEAMACCDIEDAIGLGLSILENLRRRSGKYAQCETLSWPEASDQARVYRMWLDATRRLLEGPVRELEQMGFVVQAADELRRACREISLLPLDTDRVRRSLESLETGEGVPMKQAIDGLRNRLRPGGA